MTVQIVVIVAVFAAAMIWWYRIERQSKKTLAEFKAETVRFHGSLLRRAQENLSQAELALGKDSNEVNQHAYNEAVFELDAIKNIS